MNNEFQKPVPDIHVMQYWLVTSRLRQNLCQLPVQLAVTLNVPDEADMCHL